MTVNSNAWKRLPIAARETTFDADDAIKRIQAWAKGSVEQFNSMFLWRNAQAPANNRNSYRLPIGDIVNGKPILIPRAIFAAATILSGAHGGLEGVVDEKEKLQLKRVITGIYEVLRKAYGDPRTVPPWLRGGNEEEQVLNASDAFDYEEEMSMDLGDLDALITASVRTKGWEELGVADAEAAWSKEDAADRMWILSAGNVREYAKAFVWHDPAAPEQRNSYRLPVADVVDDQIAIIPNAVRTTAQILAASPRSLAVPDSDLEAVTEVVTALRARLDDPRALVAAAFPVAPPDEWFEPQNLTGSEPLTVTADGQVSGYAWLWGTCHQGIGDRCVVPPRTASGYRYFANGAVLTASGKSIKVGKITKGTGHASIRLGWVPAADHYDNTGTTVAVVAIHEDAYGGQLAGAIVANASDADVAELRRSPISGDWRRINGSLELVAALAVNTPGFPIVALNASGDTDCILAAGIQAAEDTDPGCGCPERSNEWQDSVVADFSDNASRLSRIASDFEKSQTSRRARRLANIRAIVGGE